MIGEWRVVKLDYKEFAQQYITDAENVYQRIIELKSKIKRAKSANETKILRDRILALEQVYSECIAVAHHIIKIYAED